LKLNAVKANLFLTHLKMVIGH